MTMKRLFILRYGKGGAVVTSNGVPLYFDHKPDAKWARDQLGTPTVVSYGPDHHKYKGV